MKKLLIISDTIRRDLHTPLKYLSGVKVIHLYKNASYGDMAKEDFKNPNAIKFTNSINLFLKIIHFKPDILQAPEPIAGKTSVLAAIVCLIYWFFYHPKLIIPCFENRPFAKKSSKIKLLIINFLYKLFSSRVDVFIVLNKGAKNNLTKLGIAKEKIKNILWGSWGINLNEFKLIPQSNSEKLRAKNILFLGRVSKAKGVLQLLEAFKAVKINLPASKLLIVGPTGDASNFIQKSTTSGVEVRGSIKNSAVHNLFSEAKILVMPSQTTKEWEEQVGMVGLQAMACGLPVVTTNSGAIPEYFKNNNGAIIVEEKDTKTLAQAIEKLLTDDNFYTEQSQLARKYIEDNFDLEKRMKLIDEFLEKL